MSRKSRRNSTAVAVHPKITETQQRDFYIVESVGARARGQLTKSSAWDESEALGIPSTARRNNNLSERDYKDTLCKAYINNPWIAACIDARVLRLVSGTWELEPTCDDADEKVRDEIMELLLYVNDDEDLMQLLYSYALDIMIYGEGYIEIVRGGKGKPVDMPTSLQKVDCPTMSYSLDDHGNILGYQQQLTHQTKVIPLQPEQIMRCWFPSPESSKKALSPIAKLINSAMLYEQMMEWARNFFKKGARPPFSFKHPGDKRKADEFLLWIRENFTGKQNQHVPLMTYDGVEMQYAPSGPVDLDFLQGLAWIRQETLSSLQTPPAAIAIAETGNLGGDSSESQFKQYVNNGVKPLDRLITEKFNYAIINKGFKTRQWRLKLNMASYANDDAVAKTEDMRIRNGTSTPNEARITQNKPTYVGYGDTPFVATGKEITPLDRLDSLSQEMADSSAVDLAQKKANVDLTNTQIETAKKNASDPQQTADATAGNAAQQQTDKAPSEPTQKESDATRPFSPSHVAEAWQAPTKEQRALEDKMSNAILDYLEKRVSKSALTKRLVTLITDARQLGRGEAQKKVLAKHGTLKAKEAASGNGYDINTEVDGIVATIDGTDSTLPDPDYADMVASNEIHGAVQSGAVDLYNDYGLPIVWVCEDKACKLCQQNADEGAIAAGNTWPSGDDSPPAHINCRCSIDYAD